MVNRRGLDMVFAAVNVAFAIAAGLFIVAIWATSHKLDSLSGRFDKIDTRIDGIDRQLKDVLETIRSWPSR